MSSHDVTWAHMMSPEITWCHLSSQCHQSSRCHLSSHVTRAHVTWAYMISPELTWCHMSSRDVTWAHMSSHDVTWAHMMSHDLTWCHKLTWCHLSSHDVTWSYMSSHHCTGESLVCLHLCNCPRTCIVLALIHNLSCILSDCCGYVLGTHMPGTNIVGWICFMQITPVWGSLRLNLQTFTRDSDPDHERKEDSWLACLLNMQAHIFCSFSIVAWWKQR